MTSSAELFALIKTAESSEAKVLRLLIELGAQVVDASEGSLLVYDSEMKDLVFAMTIGGPSGLLGQRLPLNRGLTGLAAVTREVQIGAPTFNIPNVTSHDRLNEPEAVIAAPMLVADDLVGVITAVSFKSGKRFTSHDGEIYGRLAAVAAVVVDQRHRLNAFSSHGESTAMQEPSIVELLERIARHGPAVLRHTGRILSEIDALSALTLHEG
jgi:hypothetical protein